MRSRYLLALLAGLMLAAAFPKFSIAGFAWIAPGLILFCGIGKTRRQQFWIGYVAGLAHFLTSLCWLLNIPFPVGAIAGWLALSAYLALYPAVWVWLCWKIFSRLTRNAEPVFDQTNLSPCRAELFLPITWKQRAVWSISCAAIWVALEMVMARMFSGFPWNFLGITQCKMIPLIQFASFTGVYGVSFLLVWFAVSLCTTGCLLIQKPPSSRLWFGEIALPGIVAALLFNFGLNQLKRHDPPVRELKVALVQPSIPQTLIFDPSQSDTRFEKLIELSEKALAEKPDVLIWPEAAMPPLDEAKFRAITNLIVSHQVWIIFGADDAAIHEIPGGRLETNYYNSSFLFAPNGRAAATYRKRRLVIFGEYVPMSRWLPFMKWLTPIDGGFTPGEGHVPFQIASPHARISTLICFEDAFPQYAREHVETDTDFLLNLTN
ncbi:MAG: apolipoprotein N-acyltransferase, partial [Verrucomicrobiota bacterium]